jgi:hypothetical protein
MSVHVHRNAHRQSGDIAFVVTDDPVAQGLPIHTTAVGSLLQGVIFQYKGRRKKPWHDTRVSNTRGSAAA